MTVPYYATYPPAGKAQVATYPYSEEAWRKAGLNLGGIVQTSAGRAVFVSGLSVQNHEDGSRRLCVSFYVCGELAGATLQEGESLLL